MNYYSLIALTLIAFPIRHTYSSDVVGKDSLAGVEQTLEKSWLSEAPAVVGGWYDSLKSSISTINTERIFKLFALEVRDVNPGAEQVDANVVSKKTLEAGSVLLNAGFEKTLEGAKKSAKSLKSFAEQTHEKATAGLSSYQEDASQHMPAIKETVKYHLKSLFIKTKDAVQGAVSAYQGCSDRAVERFDTAAQKVQNTVTEATRTGFNVATKALKDCFVVPADEYAHQTTIFLPVDRVVEPSLAFSEDVVARMTHESAYYTPVKWYEHISWKKAALFTTAGIATGVVAKMIYDATCSKQEQDAQTAEC